MRASGIDDVGALSALIYRRLEDALAFDQQIVSAVQSTGAGLGNARLADFKPERIELGIYFCFEGLVRKMLEFEKTAIRKARAKAKSAGV